MRNYALESLIRSTLKSVSVEGRNPRIIDGVESLIDYLNEKDTEIRKLLYKEGKI